MGKHIAVWWHTFKCAWPLKAKLADCKLIVWFLYSCGLSPGNSRAYLATGGVVVVELRTMSLFLARWGLRWKKSQSLGVWLWHKGSGLLFMTIVPIASIWMTKDSIRVWVWFLEILAKKIKIKNQSTTVHPIERQTFTIWNTFFFLVLCYAQLHLSLLAWILLVFLTKWAAVGLVFKTMLLHWFFGTECLLLARSITYFYYGYLLLLLLFVS